MNQHSIRIDWIEGIDTDIDIESLDIDIDYSSSSRNTIKESIENFNESIVNKDRFDGRFGWWDYSHGLDIGWYGNGMEMD